MLHVFMWAEMPTKTGTIYMLSLMFFKQSSDNSFSQAAVTFEVAAHQECMCLHGGKIVICTDFPAYYWVESQWHLSKYRVRRWTWCNSTSTLGSYNNRLDRTNKKLYKRWQDIVLQNYHFYQRWPECKGLWGRQQHSEGRR